MRASKKEAPTQKQIMESFFSTASVPHLFYNEERDITLPRAFFTMMGFNPDIEPGTLPEKSLRIEWEYRVGAASKLIPVLWGQFAGKPVREVLLQFNKEVSSMNAAAPAMRKAKAAGLEKDGNTKAYCEAARTYVEHAQRFVVLLSMIADTFIRINFDRLSIYLTPELFNSFSRLAIRRNAVLLMPLDFNVKQFNEYLLVFRRVNSAWKEIMSRRKGHIRHRTAEKTARRHPASQLPVCTKPLSRADRIAGYVPRERPAEADEANGHSLEKSEATFRRFDPLSQGLEELERAEPMSAKELRALLAEEKVSQGSVIRLIIGGPLARKVFLTAARKPAFIKEFGDSLDDAARGIGYIGGFGVKEADARRALGPNGKRIFEWLESHRMIKRHGHDDIVYLSRDA